MEPEADIGERHGFEKHLLKSDPIPDPRTGRIIKDALNVPHVLGAHFQELTIQRVLVHEFSMAGMDFGRGVEIPVYYKGKRLHTRRVDFVVEDCLVEIKAKVALEPREFEQTLSYLKASGDKVVLILNFGNSKLEIKRISN